ncbi:MAG: phosphoribosyltransferase [Cyanobacteria bacterium P01_A01_bin.84]
MPCAPLFSNRIDAGEKIAQAVYRLFTEEFSIHSSFPLPVVYALPRGGIPVAVAVAKTLCCPLNIVVAKKISHPEHPELAIGAVNVYGDVIWTKNLTKNLTKKKLFSDGEAEAKFGSCSSSEKTKAIEKAIEKATEKVKLLEKQFSPACPQVDVKDAIVILVDDGIATGMTIMVAANALRKLLPAQIWLCTPVAPLRLLPYLRQYVNRLIILETPEYFASVSDFYVNFHQVETKEALLYLREVNG